MDKHTDSAREILAKLEVERINRTTKLKEIAHNAFPLLPSILLFLIIAAALISTYFISPPQQDLLVVIMVLGFAALIYSHRVLKRRFEALVKLLEQKELL